VIEVAKSFADAQIGLDAGIGRAVLIATCGQSGQGPGAYRVVAVLRIPARNPVLHEKGKISKAILGSGVVLDPWRQVDGQFRIGPRNQIESLAVVQVPGAG
jgi:hypothetical protein